MGEKSGTSTAFIVLGVLQFALSLGLYGLCVRTAWITFTSQPLTDYLTLGNFAVASMYLLVSILAIVAGNTEHPCPYTAAIVFSIITVVVAVIAAVASTFGLFIEYRFLYGPDDGTAMNYGDSFKSLFTENFYKSSTNLSPLFDLRFGVAAINILSCIILLPLAIVACCGMSNVNKKQSLDKDGESDSDAADSPSSDPSHIQTYNIDTVHKTTPRFPDPPGHYLKGTTYYNGYFNNAALDDDLNPTRY